MSVQNHSNLGKEQKFEVHVLRHHIYFSNRTRCMDVERAQQNQMDVERAQQLTHCPQVVHSVVCHTALKWQQLEIQLWHSQQLVASLSSINLQTPITVLTILRYLYAAWSMEASNKVAHHTWTFVHKNISSSKGCREHFKCGEDCESITVPKIHFLTQNSITGLSKQPHEGIHYVFKSCIKVSLTC